MSIEQFIDNEVKSNDVVLFMKGTPQFPQCGFSGQVVQILDHIGVGYKGLNVLESADLRNGIKTYSNWPTIPQLYVKGEFVGGCDIIREMFQAGELQQLLVDKGVNVLENTDIRQGVKEYSNWPTIPQLYVKGEFVGGCDIIREMFQEGELQTLLTDKGVPVAEVPQTA